VPKGAKDSAGSGGVRSGFMTHSACLTSSELFEPSAESHPARIGT
jgi:hypothetical protein